MAWKAVATEANQEILLNRLTEARANNLDNLDAPVSSAGNTVIVQRGISTLSSASNAEVTLDVSISPVDMSKSFVVVGAFGNVTGGTNSSLIPRAYLLNNTTLRIVCLRYNQDPVVPWEVVQIA